MVHAKTGRDVHLGSFLELLLTLGFIHIFPFNMFYMNGAALPAESSYAELSPTVQVTHS